jgi:8-oxo-dGTP pyrophosphatase MutT (NUDIX family)
MRFDHVVALLERRLAGALPGASAHAFVAPLPRRQWPTGFNPARIRHAAGLLLVFPDHDNAHVMLTVRAGTLARHSGQVSLPGGVVDPGETFEQAALREAHEEVALPLDAVRVLGALTPIDIPVSGFRLHPIVAAMPTRPAVVASDGEVARILSVPLDDLLDARRLQPVERIRDEIRLTVPAFHVEGEEIWGATAMVLAEFLTILDWPGPPPQRS